MDAAIHILATIAFGSLPAPDPIEISWVRLAPGDIRAVCAPVRGSVPSWVEIRGCHVKLGRVCYVIAPDPDLTRDALGRRTYARDQWSTLGHEVKHCYDGLFHDPVIDR